VNNPFMQYKQQSINTMSGGELIVTLFEEVTKNINIALIMFGEGKIDVALVNTAKAKKIFSHLIGVLDFNIEISQNLYQLYTFFNQEIIASEARLSGEPLKEILPLVQDLKNTWAEAQKLIHMGK